MILLAILQISARTLIYSTNQEHINYSVENATHKQNKELEEGAASIDIDGITLTYSSVADAIAAAKVLQNVHSNSVKIEKAVVSSVMDVTNRTLENQIETGEFNVAIAYTDDEKTIKEIAAMDIPRRLKVFLSTKSEDAERNKVPFPGLLVYNANDRSIVRMHMPINGQSIAATACLSCVDYLTHENRNLFMTVGTPVYYLLTDGDLSHATVSKEYFGAAKTIKDGGKIGVFFGKDVQGLMDIIKPVEGDYPILFKIDGQEQYVVRHVSPATLNEAIELLNTKKAERIIRSVNIPEDNQSRPLKVASYHSFFKNIIEDLSKDRILFISLPDCKHCNDAKPAFTALGNISAAGVDVYELDASANDVPVYDGLDYSGSVPRIFFIAKGTKKLEDIGDRRTLEALLGLLEEKNINGIKVADFAKEIEESKKPKMDQNDILQQLMKQFANKNNEESPGDVDEKINEEREETL